MLDVVTRPISSVLRAAVRPETYPGHAREVVSAAVTAAMWPFGLADRSVAEVRRLAGEEPIDSRIATPVLLIHGFAANKSNWWFLQRDLRAAGFGRVHALNYNPFTTDVPEIATNCVRRAHEVMAATGTDRIHLVGHSMGGIIARYAVQLGGLTEAATCITVASPHKGVTAGRVPVPGLSSLRSLAPDSPVLARLAASARRLDTRFVAYYSNLDVLVPGHRGRIEDPALRAANVLIRDEGHLSILLSRRLSASLLQELAAAEGVPGIGRGLSGLPARAIAA